MILIILIIVICIIFLLRINKIENFSGDDYWSKVYGSIRNHSNTSLGRTSGCPNIDAFNRLVSCSTINGINTEGCKKKLCQDASDRCKYSTETVANPATGGAVTKGKCSDKESSDTKAGIYFTGTRDEINRSKNFLKNKCESTTLNVPNIDDRKNICKSQMYCVYNTSNNKCLFDTDEFNNHSMVTEIDSNYNCNSKEVWSLAKKRYCCTEKNKKCSDYYDCNSNKANWSTHQKTFCENQEAARTASGTSTSSSSSSSDSSSGSSSGSSSSSTGSSTSASVSGQDSTLGEDSTHGEDKDVIDPEELHGTFPEEPVDNSFFTAKIHRRNNLKIEPVPLAESETDLEIEKELSVEKQVDVKYKVVKNEGFCSIM